MYFFYINKGRNTSSPCVFETYSESQHYEPVDAGLSRAPRQLSRSEITEGGDSLLHEGEWHFVYSVPTDHNKPKYCELPNFFIRDANGACYLHYSVLK